MKHRTYLTIGEASKLAKVNKSTISRALKSGRMSYVSKDSDGYKIDPAELSRVFKLQPTETPATVAMQRSAPPNETPNATIKNAHEIEILKLKLNHAEKLVEIYKDQAENWKKQAHQLLLQSPKNDKNDIKKLVRDELINIMRKKRQQKNN
jgi:hypothetical protein